MMESCRLRMNSSTEKHRIYLLAVLPHSSLGIIISLAQSPKVTKIHTRSIASVSLNESLRTRARTAIAQFPRRFRNNETISAIMGSRELVGHRQPPILSIDDFPRQAKMASVQRQTGGARE